MPKIMTDEAIAIAKKLARDTGDGKLTVSETEGRKHRVIMVYYDGKKIGQFGIQRGSQDKQHNYISEQLYLSRKQAYSYAICKMDSKKFIAILKDKKSYCVEAQTNPEILCRASVTGHPPILGYRAFR